MTTNRMTDTAAPNPGSFRDPANRVYEGDGFILRGVNQQTLTTYHKLISENFFQKFITDKSIIDTEEWNQDKHPAIINVLEDGWAGVLNHKQIPFISYPYEWSFSMLKDAALLHLNLIEKSIENGWILKDATPYNIQWIGAHPTFIDIPSFQSWEEGDQWVGYRQFCSMFLTPLMLKAHANIDYLPLIRSKIDGIEPTEAIKYFRGVNRYKKGVLSHIYFPAKVENHISKRERDTAPAQRRVAGRQSTAMILGLVQSITRIVKGLKSNIKHTDWSQYSKCHSYDDADFSAKKTFVLKHLSSRKWHQTWDIGCNTGTFSQLCSEHSDYVIAVDGDHDAVEQLYLSEKNKDQSNILPLVMNLSNISPNQGWAGLERTAFDERKKPDLVLCLALIHHIRISANIPIPLFLKWLHILGARIVIEFVNRNDEMVVKLLTNKQEQYEDYNLQTFITEAEKYFNISDRQPLKDDRREIFFLEPK